MNKKELLEASFEEKVKQSKRLIMDWYYQFKGNVYVAFSGGKDSTVLLHLVRSLFPDVPAVFNDTGLEFPAIRKFVSDTPNVVFLKPKHNFKWVLEKHGYPVISKQQSQYIYQYRCHKSEKTKHLRWYGNDKGLGKISEVWKFLVNAPFKISDACCNILKKNPAKKYEKETGRKPFLGIMATESNLRKQAFFEGECNAFKAKRPVSRPLMFWTDEDIWKYLKTFNVPYCDLYDKGLKRTGCMFCLYGCQHDDSNRWDVMMKEYPKIYKYCMEKLNIKNILEYIRNKGDKNE